jgi:hypothetical protein
VTTVAGARAVCARHASCSAWHDGTLGGGGAGYTHLLVPGQVSVACVVRRAVGNARMRWCVHRQGGRWDRGGDRTDRTQRVS